MSSTTGHATPPLNWRRGRARPSCDTPSIWATERPFRPAISTSLSRGAEILVQMDADGQHDPAEVPILMEPVLSGDLDLVVGSRFLVDTDYEMAPLRRVGRFVFQWDRAPRGFQGE